MKSIGWRRALPRRSAPHVIADSSSFSWGPLAIWPAGQGRYALYPRTGHKLNAESGNHVMKRGLTARLSSNDEIALLRVQTAAALDGWSKFDLRFGVVETGLSARGGHHPNAHTPVVNMSELSYSRRPVASRHSTSGSSRRSRSSFEWYFDRSAILAEAGFAPC